ncbi:MAG: flippase activity-associated protein Agl23 [Anaerolineae bacterium]
MNRAIPNDNAPSTKLSWLDRSVIYSLDWERLLYIAFFVIAVVSRLWDMGARVMSHDESLHTTYSYNLATGKGFQHTPMMHGPFLFHITAISYFLFGADDFTSRLPFAIFGVFLVISPYFFRRYLGRVGALATSFSILISPSLLYHARYIRQEGTIVVWSVLTVLFIFKYLESRKFGWLAALSAVLAFHASDKATNFFNVAIMAVFLAPLVLIELLSHKNASKDIRTALAYLGVFAGSLVGSAFLFELISSKILIPLLKPQISVQTGGSFGVSIDGGSLVYMLLMIALGAAACAGLYFLFRRLFGEWLNEIENKSPAFNILIVAVTTTMFMASAATLLVLNPIWKIFNGGAEMIAIKTFDNNAVFSNDMNMITTLFALNIGLAVVAAAVGISWNWRRWLVIIGIFFGITVPLFTTLFTNGSGIGTGFVGQLGYWMAQQGVARGSQPWYYYFILVPLYEYLPLVGGLCAMGLVAVSGFRSLFKAPSAGENQPDDEDVVVAPVTAPARSAAPAKSVAPAQTAIRTVSLGPIEFKFKINVPAQPQPHPARETRASAQPISFGEGKIKPKKIFVVYLIWWALFTFIIYSMAGEKMPWLTTHIALPLCFLTGYFINHLVTSVNWGAIRKNSMWAMAGLGAAGIVLIARVLSLIASVNTETASPQENVGWAASLALAVLLLAGVIWLMRRIAAPLTGRVLALWFFGLLSLLTIRTAVMVTYINYDYAKEFLFYAHGAPGIKIAVNQLDDLAKRVGRDTLTIGYESDVSWPMSWYMRNFSGARFMGGDLAADFQSLDAIMMGDGNANYQAAKDKLQADYTRFDYVQVWWPMQDYMDLTGERIRYSLVNVKAREALWQIVFNRNYKPYADLFNKAALTDEHWQPSHLFSLWIRNDVTDKVWDYRVGAASAAPATTNGAAPTPKPAVSANLSNGTGIAIAPNGDRYALDRKANKVIHFDSTGAVVGSWGGFGSRNGQLNDPWGITVDKDGNVIVADSFNHRVQKFTADGNVIWVVGVAGVSAEPGVGKNIQFFGPRDVAVDRNGRLLITDTGNKRVVVLDADGNYAAQFGKAGTGNGEFDEPVGITVDTAGNIYVADAWNKRIQVFNADYGYARQFKVDAWANLPENDLKAVDNKPYLASSGDMIYATSPKTRQVLAFKTNGQPVALPSVTFEPGTMPTGLDVANGKLVVTNLSGGPVLEFPLTGIQ